MNKMFPLVVVEWEDSAQPTSAWEWADELLSSEPIMCQTVGHLIHDNETCVTIALSLGDKDSDRPQVNGAMRIPRRAIIDITSLGPCEQAHDA